MAFRKWYARVKFDRRDEYNAKFGSRILWRRWQNMVDKKKTSMVARRTLRKDIMRVKAMGFCIRILKRMLKASYMYFVAASGGAWKLTGHTKTYTHRAFTRLHNFTISRAPIGISRPSSGISRFHAPRSGFPGRRVGFHGRRCGFSGRHRDAFHYRETHRETVKP